MIVACSLFVLALQPPRLIRTKGASELLVPVSDKVSVLILEANELEQEKLVDAALLADGPIGTATEDPYGVVLWPAGQVVAQAIAARDLQGRVLLELGAVTVYNCVYISLTRYGYRDGAQNTLRLWRVDS